MRKYLFLGLIGLVAAIAFGCGSDATATPRAQQAPAATAVPAQAAAQPAATAVPAATGQSFKFQHACINRTLNPCIIMMEFAAAVLERTNGQVEIQISSFPELGLAGPDTLRLLQDGTMDMGEIYGGYVSGDFPAVEMAELLGLFESSAMQEEVFRAIREDEIRMVAEQWGAKVISYVYYPDQFLWSKRPLRTLDDFKGLKTRTHSTALGDLVAGLGGEGQFIAFSEVYTALERGILDAGVTGSTPGYSQKWYEVSDYIVGPLTSHPHVMIGINQKLWDSMPGDFQKIILEEAAKAEAKNLRDVAGWDQEGVDNSVAEGMEYIAFTPEIKAGIAKAVLEKIVPNWASRAGGYGSVAVNLFNEKVAPIVGVRILPDGTAERTGATATAGGTKLVTQGASFKFQHACINRTLNPCIIMMEFAANVLDRTEGQVEIQISSFPELGLAGPDTLRLLQDGTMDMGEIYGGYVSGDFPAVEMAELLGLFESSAMQEEVFRAIREDEIRMVAEQWGAKVISYVYYPDQFLWSKRPLRTLDDFKGLKTRTHSTALGDLVAGLGGEGQFIAFSEVYTALERGILDAGVTGSTPGYSQKWYEVSDYIVGPLTSHPHVMIGINNKLWESMPGDIQQIILEEAAKAEAKNLRDVAGWDQEGVDNSVAEGMEYIAFTPEIKVGIEKAVLEKIVPNWASRAGGYGSEAVNLFNEKVAPIVGVRILPDGTAERTN